MIHVVKIFYLLINLVKGQNVCYFVEIMIQAQSIKDQSGAWEPDAKWCAFAHLIFGSLVIEIGVLHTLFLAVYYGLRT